MSENRLLDLDEIVARYCAGQFPMDDPGAPELPWWTADPRAIFELGDAPMGALRRRVRRSLHADPGWQLRVDGAFPEVIAACARPRSPEDGVWLTPRLARVYEVLGAAGLAHTFELWEGTRLVAGMVGVTLRRAAMLESMSHFVSHAGNVLVVRVLEDLRARGFELCDLQTSTPHTERLGARLIPAAEYERRLHAALAPGR